MDALLNVPDSAEPGEIVAIRVLIQHPMETGFRPAPQGGLVPRNIIHSLRCTYLGREVFSAELHPAVTANPFFAFHLRAEASGEVMVEWVDEEGATHNVSAPIAVA